MCPQFDPLLCAAEPHAAFFMKEQDCNQDFAPLRMVAEEHKMWTFTFDIPAADKGAESDASARSQLPDWLASRRKYVKTRTS